MKIKYPTQETGRKKQTKVRKRRRKKLKIKQEQTN